VTREITLCDFIIYQCVGVGGFSKVYLAKCKLNGKLCALKFISKSYIINNKKFKLLQNER
jgi:serum/glucocorticoid-regulated kinase 2